MITGKHFAGRLVSRCGVLAAIGALVLGTISASAQFAFLEGVHAYNPARDKIAQSAVTTFTNLNFLQLTEGNATNLEALQTQELALQDSENSILRDITIFAICENSKEPADDALFANYVTNRLVAIFGGSVPNAQALAKEHEADAASPIPSAVSFKASGFQTEFGAAPPTFDFATLLTTNPPLELAKLRNATNSVQFDQAYVDYVITYNKAVARDLGSGILSEAFAQLTNAYAAKAALQAEADAFSKTNKDQSNIIDAKLKDGQQNVTQTDIQTISNALHTIQSGIGDIESAGNPIAQKVSLELQLNSVDQVIAAAVSGTGSTNISSANSATKRAALITSQLPALGKAGANLETALRAPKISSLLLERNLLSIKLDAANTEINFEDQRIDALRRKYLAILLEVQMLQAIGQERTTLVTLVAPKLDLGTDWVKSESEKLGTTNLWLTNHLTLLPVTDLLASNAPPEVKKPVISGLLKLATSIRVARLREDEADLDLVNVEYLSANAADQEAVQMWNSLIATPVNEIAAYYSGGFKPADVAHLLVEGLGLGAIAWRLH